MNVSFLENSKYLYPLQILYSFVEISAPITVPEISLNSVSFEIHLTQTNPLIIASDCINFSNVNITIFTTAEILKNSQNVLKLFSSKKNCSEFNNVTVMFAPISGCKVFATALAQTSVLYSIDCEISNENSLIIGLGVGVPVLALAFVLVAILHPGVRKKVFPYKDRKKLGETNSNEIND